MRLIGIIEDNVPHHRFEVSNFSAQTGPRRAVGHLPRCLLNLASFDPLGFPTHSSFAGSVLAAGVGVESGSPIPPSSDIK